jgi:hypothetical protein
LGFGFGFGVVVVVCVVLVFVVVLDVCVVLVVLVVDEAFLRGLCAAGLCVVVVVDDVVVVVELADVLVAATTLLCVFVDELEELPPHPAAPRVTASAAPSAAKHLNITTSSEPRLRSCSGCYSGRMSGTRGHAHRQRLAQIGHQIRGILDSAAQPDQVWRHRCRRSLHRLVRHRLGHLDQRLHSPQRFGERE